MEILANRYTLQLCHGAFPLSTDSMVLADFVQLRTHDRVLDFGSGCGTLGLLLCAKYPQCQVTGLELEENAHLQALENIRRNALQSQLYSICGDLRAMPPQIPRQFFDCCISNPPYFSGGALSQKTPLARQTQSCSLSDLFQAARYALRYGGDFYLVHKPDQLASLCWEARSAGLEPKVLRLVRHQADGPVTLILLRCRKGGKPGLRWEELTLFHPDGSPTDSWHRIYHQ